MRRFYVFRPAAANILKPPCPGTPQVFLNPSASGSFQKKNRFKVFSTTLTIVVA
jgi:hypothetical protein